MFGGRFPRPSASFITILIVAGFACYDSISANKRFENVYLIAGLALVLWFGLEALFTRFEKRNLKMKSALKAGAVATLIAVIFLVGISIFLVAVMEIDASKNAFTFTAAALTIGIWTGVYNWLKPKDDEQNDSNSAPPTGETDIEVH